MPSAFCLDSQETWIILLMCKHKELEACNSVSVWLKTCRRYLVPIGTGCLWYKGVEMTTDLSWRHKWACNNFGAQFPCKCLFPLSSSHPTWLHHFGSYPQASFASYYCVIVSMYILSVKLLASCEKLYLFFLSAFLTMKRMFFLCSCLSFPQVSCKGTYLGQPQSCPPSPCPQDFKRAWKWQTWKLWIFPFAWFSSSFTTPLSHWSSPAASRRALGGNHSGGSWAACCHLRASQVPRVLNHT